MKYAEATEIFVDVKKEDNQILIVVQDNGKGFDLGTVDFGNGLHNMKKRMEEIEANYSIKSEPSKGTQISILLPIKNQS